MDFEKNVSLVSVITPAYNAELYIKQTIQSVLSQSYPNWELLIINDGSSDSTEQIILSFSDPRISYFKQNKNKGVSAARNLGLLKMKGQFICFLDADDVLTETSIEKRLSMLLNNPKIDFVDGIVNITGPDINHVKKVWHPRYKGLPQKELVRLTGSCFLSITWMIRAEAVSKIRFEDGLTHAEDLLFLAEISKNRNYDFIESPILFFRRTGNSAMSNLDGLAKGYVRIFGAFKEKKLFLSAIDKYICKAKILKIMFLSYLSAGKWAKAIWFILKNAML